MSLARLLGWTLLATAGSIGTTMVLVGMFEDLVEIVRGATSRVWTRTKT